MGGPQVAVAMSGGVDSSMAAARLKEAGYQVFGAHMLLSPDHCPEHSMVDLDRTCQILDIPLHKLNFESEYQKEVIDYFCREYSLGRTPNPCIACNQRIKFGRLLDRVLQMGADRLATGHYARIEHSPDGFRLLKGVDRTKDQSYFLYTLGQRELQHMLLPLGDYRKAEIRKMARELGLPQSDQAESQDVCFIQNEDYRSFIASHIRLAPGDITDAEDKVLGRHNGLARYTVGQRQGLGLASNERLYVLRIDTASNRLVVGTKDQLLSKKLLASKLCWVSGKAPEKPITVTAKVRYQSPEIEATIQPNNGMAEVQFHQPQMAIAPGQAIVFYQGDTVLGGGTIQDAT